MAEQERKRKTWIAFHQAMKTKQDSLQRIGYLTKPPCLLPFHGWTRTGDYGMGRANIQTDTCTEQLNSQTSALDMTVMGGRQATFTETFLWAVAFSIWDVCTFLEFTQHLIDRHVSLYNVLCHCFLTLRSVLESNYITQRDHESMLSSKKNEHFCVLDDKKVHKMTIDHALWKCHL